MQKVLHLPQVPASAGYTVLEALRMWELPDLTARCFQERENARVSLLTSFVLFARTSDIHQVRRQSGRCCYKRIGVDSANILQ